LIHHGRISNRNESLPALNTSVIDLPAFSMEMTKTNKPKIRNPGVESQID